MLPKHVFLRFLNNNRNKEGTIYKTCRNIHTAHSYIPKTKHKDAHTEDNEQQKMNARKDY